MELCMTGKTLTLMYKHQYGLLVGTAWGATRSCKINESFRETFT